MHIIHKQLTASAQTKDEMDRENTGTRCKDIYRLYYCYCHFCFCSTSRFSGDHSELGQLSVLTEALCWDCSLQSRQWLKVKGKGIPVRPLRPELIPDSQWITTWYSCQYSLPPHYYIPGRTTSPLCVQYQIILLGNRHMCEYLIRGRCQSWTSDLFIESEAPWPPHFCAMYRGMIK